MRTILFSLLFFLCLAPCLHDAHAQTKSITIKGRVSDQETHEGLPGVTILLQGTPPRALGTTDALGNFNLTVPENAQLTFRLIGYKAFSARLRAGQTTLNARLNSEESTMQEVVVRGYQTRQRETSTGSSNIISGKDLQDVPVSSPEQLLQGRVPGLNIQNNTGAPGFRGSVAIRGLSTLSVSGSGSEQFLAPTSPLYVIDGVPLDADKAAEFGFQQQGPGVSPLSLIPQEDIASMEILKDAQATSLYGSRGAYGVIIITTKRGNSKIPRVRYTGNFFLNTPPKLRETLGGVLERQVKLMQIYNNTSTNYTSFNVNGNAISFNSDILRISQSPFLADSLNAYYNNSTDWQDVFYATTYNQTHNIMIDGGDPKFNYKSNLGYYSEKGVIKNTGFERYNMNMNMEFKPNDKLRFFGQLMGSLGKQNKGSGSGLLQSGVAGSGMASTLLPTPSFYLATSDVISALTIANDNNSKNLRLSGEGNYMFIPGLNFTAFVSYDYTSNTEDRFLPAAANNLSSQVYSYYDRNYTLYNREGLSYAKALNDDHNIFVNGFTEFYIQGVQGSITRQEKSPSDSYQGPLGFDGYFSRGGGVLQNFKNARLLSYALAFSYDFRKKYVIDLTYRLDGSSSSGNEDPFSKNPSIGLRWNFNKENLLADAKWLSYGALRLSWGKNIQPTGTLEGIYGRYNPNGLYNNNNRIGINYEFIPNPNLRPTQTTQYNLGIDGGLFESRIEFVFDTYYKQVNDLTFENNLPTTLGFQKYISNQASIANYGYELLLTGRPLAKTSPFTLTITANGAINKDVLLGLPDQYGGQYIRFDPDNNVSQHVMFKVGRNTLSNYLLNNTGVYSTNADVPVDPVTGLRYRTNANNTAFFRAGDPIWQDVNGDYVVDGNDYRALGNSQPNITGGLSVNLNYKSFGLNVYSSFTKTRAVLNNALADRLRLLSSPFGITANGLSGQDIKAVVPLNDLNYWQMAGDQAVFPYPYDYYRNGIINPMRLDQTLWQEDGTYFKLNNVTFSYLFPKKMIRKVGLNSLRAYVSSNNLYTFSRYRGPNAENVTALGRDASGGYPVPRTYNLGLNIEL